MEKFIKQHPFEGDHEHQCAAAVLAFNAALPVGSTVTVQPLPVPPKPVSTRTKSGAFVLGTKVYVYVNGEEQPVEISRVKGARA